METCRTLAQKPGVLVVDDDAAVRALLDVGLRQEGFAVWLAEDGRVALNLYWHCRELIDMVLLDVRMPRLDGPETLAALQELNPRIRCCFMSGDLGRCTEEGLRNLGALTLFPKPFYLSEVAHVLWQHARMAEPSLSRL